MLEEDSLLTPDMTREFLQSQLTDAEREIFMAIFLFEGFSDMYGSMTTIVLIMLWLYLCMYVILLGGEVNALLEKYLDNHKNCDKIIK